MATSYSKGHVTYPDSSIPSNWIGGPLASMLPGRGSRRDRPPPVYDIFGVPRDFCLHGLKDQLVQELKKSKDYMIEKEGTQSLDFVAIKIRSSLGIRVGERLLPRRICELRCITCPRLDLILMATKSRLWVPSFSIM